MEYHKKNGIVFLVQVDHLSGEQIGSTIDQFYQAGASNVQIMSSITKKNRPSYVVLIDCREEKSSSVEERIPDLLGAGGWHKIGTEHHFLYNRIEERKLRIQTETKGTGPEWTVKGKWFENGNLRPEHDSVIGLQEAVFQYFNEHISYNRAYYLIMRCLENAENEETVLNCFFNEHCPDDP